MLAVACVCVAIFHPAGQSLDDSIVEIRRPTKIRAGISSRTRSGHRFASSPTVGFRITALSDSLVLLRSSIRCRRRVRYRSERAAEIETCKKIPSLFGIASPRVRGGCGCNAQSLFSLKPQFDFRKPANPFASIAAVYRLQPSIGPAENDSIFTHSSRFHKIAENMFHARVECVLF
ncbi:hypothetical protein CA51_15890 [Rosistilla oblonga]|nr:hypothetical protein CA51_15890 [Rosistilla oblonga]